MKIYIFTEKYVAIKLKYKNLKEEQDKGNEMTELQEGTGLYLKKTKLDRILFTSK